MSLLADNAKGLSIDEVLPLIGEFGRYQILLEILFCLLKASGSMTVLLPYFTQHNPGWQCTHNSTICSFDGVITSASKHYESRCNMPRSEWQFSQPKEYSVVTQFDIYCGMELYNTLSTSLFFVAWGFGAVILGGLADKYGRRIVTIASLVSEITIGFVSAFAPCFEFYMIARVLIGFFIPGSLANMFILISEFTGPKFRPLAGIINLMIFPVSVTFLALQAYYIRSWKLLVIISTAPYFFFFLFFPYFPESLRWLSLHGKQEVAMKEIKKIAKMNGKELPDFTLAELGEKSEKNSRNILILFSSKRMAINSLITGFAWATIALVYYGIGFAAADLGGTMYRDYTILAVSEIPAMIIGVYLCHKIGRKKTVMIPMLFGGLACIAASLITTKDQSSKLMAVRVSLGIVGKIFLSITYNSLYTWSIELYPTVVRSTAMGYLQTVARIGGTVAPWVGTWLVGVHPVLPFSLMGGMAVVCAITLIKLPETAAKPTAETFDDLNERCVVKIEEKEEFIEMA